MGISSVRTTGRSCSFRPGRLAALPGKIMQYFHDGLMSLLLLLMFMLVNAFSTSCV